MRSKSLLPLGALIAGPAVAAGSGTVTVTIPQLSVAEYHRPYVAVWLEPAAGGPAQTVAVWYDVHKAGNEPGTKWLSELRAWWRKGGRSMTLPANGISGATQAPGSHVITLPTLPVGQYVLNVEAARETGGRELVTVPISIPVGGGAHASGKTELGAVTLSAR